VLYDTFLQIRELVIPMVDISRRTIIKATGAVGATMLPLADAPRKASAEGQQGHPDGHEHPTHSDVPSASGSQQGYRRCFKFNATAVGTTIYFFPIARLLDSLAE
jgi:hypothetical protein